MWFTELNIVRVSYFLLLVLFTQFIVDTNKSRAVIQSNKQIINLK